jgi:lipoate-protein ligase A
MRWRMVDFEYWSAAMNMGIDEAVSEAVAAETCAPTIRFYGWRPSAVTIGCFQSLKEEVDYHECVRLGIDVVRRRTGGGAVFHDEEGEITYSVIASEDLMPSDINKAYQLVCGHIVAALKSLGLEASFSPINDVLVAGKKISGSAQTRRGGVFLQHGTLLLDLRPEVMFKVLKVSQAKMSGRSYSDPAHRVTSLRNFGIASRSKVLQALQGAFTDGKDWEEGGWTVGELKRARHLAEQRYSSKEWNFSR